MSAALHVVRADAPAVAPPEAGFTGDVRIAGHHRRAAPSRLVTATLRFAPGARTPWTVNPIGQTLVVIAGAGCAQCDGGAVAALRAGDVAWFPPGVRHWTGATPGEAMTCVAIQEEDGRGVIFGEEVTDEG